MIMMSIAVGYGCSIKADWLAIGVHAGDHAIYPDCRKEFIDAFTSAVELCDWHPFTIFAPFQDLDKKAILEIGIPLGVDYSNTWTCYKGLDEPCGTCGSCTERNEAFETVFGV
jgi:7-cyano-7-deazaguanine synthase